MAPVQRILGGQERTRAQELGAAQKVLAAAEARLQELQQYHADYTDNFKRSARAGSNAMALRDYKQFLGKLEDAIRQQQQIVAQAQQGAATSNKSWQSAARRVKAVEAVVDRWQGEERLRADRQEQRESDDRGRRPVGGNATRND